MKTSWWYESAIYDLDRVLVFARLTIQENGRAQVLTDDGVRHDFESEERADIWLTDEEFVPFENLLEEVQETGKPADPRLRQPSGKTEEEVIKCMVVNLKDQPPLPTTPSSLPGAEQVH